MTADEAAGVLGISRSSLYAYVSRKKLRVTILPGRRERLYWREDVERLSTRSQPHPSAEPDKRLLHTSAITFITDDGVFYRGRSAVEMSQTETLESAAAHLWQVKESDVFGASPPPGPDELAAARACVAHLKTIERAISLFPLLEGGHPRSYDLSPAGFALNGADIMRWYVAIMVGDKQPSADPIHAVIAERLRAPRGFDDLIRRLLVLFLDHELTPPTYAVRAAANTGVTPYQAVSVGLNSCQGRRVQAGRSGMVRRFVAEILDAVDPVDPVRRRYSDGEGVPGFGGGVYPGRDPRAFELLRVIEEQHGDRASARKLLSAIKLARDLYGGEPGVVLVHGYIAHELGFAHDDGGLAIAARLAGWIAHASEQYHSEPMSRFAAAYVGTLP